MNNDIQTDSVKAVGSGAGLAGVYFCVTDPHNNIVHTTISLTREGAIN